jgi:hypothetical protein
MNHAPKKQTSMKKPGSGQHQDFALRLPHFLPPPCPVTTKTGVMELLDGAKLTEADAFLTRTPG